MNTFADSNPLQNFERISNILDNLEMPVNIYDYASEFNHSVEDAQIILNNFIAQLKDINKYIIIFRAEILEIDSEVGRENISFRYFPSYSQELKKLLSDSTCKILDFGVYCILNKIENFELNDFSIFSHKMQKICKFDLDRIQKDLPKVKLLDANQNKNNSKTKNNLIVNNNIADNFSKNKAANQSTQGKIGLASSANNKNISVEKSSINMTNAQGIF